MCFVAVYECRCCSMSKLRYGAGKLLQGSGVQAGWGSFSRADTGAVVLTTVDATIEQQIAFRGIC
jgi:hypothetical protein